MGLRLPIVELVLIRLGLGLLGGHFGLVVFKQPIVPELFVYAFRKSP